MKKELLLATTIAGVALGATSASAVTSTISGNHRVGLLDVDKDSSNATTATTNSDIKSSFSVSLEETLDSGTKIATSFVLATEGTDGLNPSGLTLTFTDGSKLDLIEAGNAYATHVASVPGASGEQGLTGLTTNSAPTGLNFADTSDNVGFEWTSAADAFGIDG